MDFASLSKLVQDGGKPWVRLRDGLRISLVGVADARTFVGKFIPCATNANTYKIKFSEIVGIIEEK